MPWDGYHMMNWFPFFGFWMMIFWLIILIAIAYLIHRLMRGDKDLVPGRVPGRTARDILDERYAKGDLSREDYLRMKEDITGSRIEDRTIHDEEKEG